MYDENYFKRDPELKAITEEQKYSLRNIIPYRLVIHHSGSHSNYHLDNIRDNDVQNAFNVYGTANYKKWKISKSFHTFPNSNKETFAQAHFALHRFDRNNNTWSLVPLTQCPLSDICWHAGNVDINRVSFGIEICGNWEGYRDDITSRYINTRRRIEDAALAEISKVFKPYHQWLLDQPPFFDNGYIPQGFTKGLIITGHKNHAATDCPGAIYDQLDELRDMIYS
jgi:hypothetical protein